MTYHTIVLRCSILLTVMALISGSLNALTPAQASTSTEVKLPDGVDPATGFRMQRYRAPVPDTLPGGQVLDTERVKARLNSKLVFIDVYPPRGLGADPLDGSWRLSEQHDTIEQAVWLPEVGRGYIEQEHVDYFQRNLASLTHGDMDTPLLFFCTADCWQSWNAARRAILWGYSRVFWYPEGTDGWLDAGLELVPGEPVNFLGE